MKKTGKRFILWLLRNKRGGILIHVNGNPIIHYRRKDAVDAAKRLDTISEYKAVRAELIVTPRDAG